MSSRPQTLRVASLLAASAIAGCSVMKIDVDVYKGPLADHVDVQTEQFAAMAIGAKPLLTQLRDRLQWPDDKDRACARAQEAYPGASTDVFLVDGIYSCGSFLPRRRARLLFTTLAREVSRL